MSTEADDTEAEVVTPELERKARDMGWVPENEWRGGTPPKSGFVDAAEYVRRGEKIVPIIRAEAKKWETEAKTLRAELETTRAEHRKNIGRIERMSTLALQQQRENIESQYASRKEAAVEVGDKAAYQQAVKDEREATKALDERLKEPADTTTKDTGKQQALPKEVQDVIETWRRDNPWFTDQPDDEMTAYATARHMRLQKEARGLTLAQNLERVTADVRKKFPEHFGGEEMNEDDDEPKTSRGSRVEGGSRQAGSNGSRSLFSKLPADAKSQCDRFIKDDGLFLEKGETVDKNIAQARERYAKKYFEGETA